MKPIFVSDCEGPIVKNDIALDLAIHFIPEGDRVYDIICKYDFVHANFPKRRDYVTGSASKLVLPFLVAFDADNKTVEEFCGAHLDLLSGSKTTLNYVSEISEAFLVSKSYEHFVRALCRKVGFPLENTFGTEVNLDQYELSTKDKSKLKSLAWEIGGLSPLTVPPSAKGIRDLPKEDQETISRLDRIFWKEVTSTRCKKLLSDVTIPGSSEKVSAVREVVQNLSSPVENVMYVGDDETDVEAMRFVRDGGGLTVSINGDEAAVRSAELAVLSDSSAPISVLADAFLRLGRAETTKIATNFDRESLWRSPANPLLLDHLFELKPANWPKVYFVTEYNMKPVIEASERFRDNVVANRKANLV